MAIIGFSFSKLTAEHKKTVKTGVKINTNIKIDSVAKTKLAFDDKRTAIKSTFTYSVVYDPEVGSIDISGEVLSMHEKKDADLLLAGWEKDKSLPPAAMNMFLSHIMQKSSMQALIVSKDVGLPSPIPLPKLRKPTAKKAVKK